MKKTIFLCAFLFTALFAGAQSRTVKAVSNDTTINPGKIVIVNGAEVLDPDVNNNLDSLLSVWYLQRALRDTTGAMFNMEDNFVSANLPDSLYIERLGRMPSLIELPYNEAVRNSIVFYTQRIPQRSEMILGLSQYYLPMIEEVFDGYNLPLELRAMAIIESALNPRAVSRAKAKGMWQFMYRTALDYDLKINSYVDERLDPVAATHAAAKYLKDLYGIFGDWSLAIAAYNCGAGGVNKAIRRSGGKRNFWDIYPYLPRETRGYVPNFIAASYLLTYYKDHRLTPKLISMPAQVDTFVVNKMLHFDQISEVIGIPIDELRDFNPQYMHDVVPGKICSYSLCIPYEYTSLFAEKENEIYTYKDSLYFNPNIVRQIAEGGVPKSVSGRSQTVHRVQKGENLNSIAAKYSVSVSDIKYWNNVGSQIKVGQKLIVNASSAKTPAAKKAAPPTKIADTSPTKIATKTAAATTTPAPSPKQPTATATKYAIHVVKAGETLWGIAQAYEGMAFSDLLQLNNFTKNSPIHPGDKIKVKKF